MAFVTHLYLCGFLLAGSLPVLLSQQCQCVVTSEGIIRSEMASALENIAEQIRCLKDQVNNLTSTTSCRPCGVGSRLAVSLDMGDTSQQCPSPWIEGSSPNRSCFAQNYDNCIGVRFPVSGGAYSRVCGRAIGYGTATPDAFFNGYGLNDGSINAAYLDGISVTHGLPRQHIWSFANGVLGTRHRCPCDNADRRFAPLPPAFVGNNYFCDGDYDGALWDGMDCTSPCCTFNSPPWFNVTLPTSTTDDIEVRICSDQNVVNEATFLRLMEFYVQ